MEIRLPASMERLVARLRKLPGVGTQTAQRHAWELLRWQEDELQALAEELAGEEMDHMAQVAAQPESMARAEQSIRDYISVIRGEGLLRSGGRADDLLVAAQKKYLEKKAYMEEKP